jgi:uncharacterized membrane protein YsdA (DUF1294 family)
MLAGCSGLVSLVLFRNDKVKAQNSEWRIPEKTLFLSMLLGGCVVGGIGIFKLRHKSHQHTSFKVVFLLSALIWTGVLGAMVYVAVK